MGQLLCEMWEGTTDELMVTIQVFRPVFAVTQAVPNLFGTRDWFRGKQFFHSLEWGGDGLGMTHVH